MPSRPIEDALTWLRGEYREEPARRRRVTMNSAGTFTNEGAPCGQTVHGERYEDRDEEVMVTEQECYACGRVVKTLVDELFAAH